MRRSISQRGTKICIPSRYGVCKDDIDTLYVTWIGSCHLALAIVKVRVHASEYGRVEPRRGVDEKRGERGN